MASMAIMFVFSVLNMCSIILWSANILIALDVVVCQPNAKFKRILPRDICVWLTRLKRRFNLDHKFSTSVFVLVGSTIAMITKFSELSEILDYNNYKVCLRIMASVAIPYAIIKLYNIIGFKSVLFKK